MITISIAFAANLSSNTHGVIAQISKGRQELRPEVSDYIRARALRRDFVNLHNLRPSLGADLSQLRDLVDAGGWRSALPEALPEPVLLMLALDFRSVEASFTRAESSYDEIPSLSAALFMVTNLLFQHPARIGDPGGVTLSENGMVHALQVYQWAIEREILTRITGVPHGGPSLLDELLRCLDD